MGAVVHRERSQPRPSESLSALWRTSRTHRDFSLATFIGTKLAVKASENCPEIQMSASLRKG